MHPTEIQDEQLRSYLLDQWCEKLQRDGGADDQLMVFGGKLKKRDLAIVSDAIREFIAQGDEPGRSEILAWFLCGYLTPDTELPPDIVHWINGQTLQYADDQYVRDPLLNVAVFQLRYHKSEQTRQEIRETIDKILQTHPLESIDDWVGDQIKKVLNR
jgi:hypothetical protein